MSLPDFTTVDLGSVDLGGAAAPEWGPGPAVWDSPEGIRVSIGEAESVDKLLAATAEVVATLRQTA